MPNRPPTYRPPRPAQPQPAPAPRATAAERGYGYRWQCYRKAFLAEHPLCVECEKEGRVEAAVVVDHIVPHKGDEHLFWLETNHQGLCLQHHNEKTAKEGAFGRPMDPNHAAQHHPPAVQPEG